VFAEVCAAALGLGFAWYSIADIPKKQTPAAEQTLRLNVSGSLPPLVLNESGSVFSTYMLFDEKKDAIEIGDPQLKQLNELVQTLGECVQDGDDVIHIVVRAYASSSGTDADNYALYRARGRHIEALINASIAATVPSKQSQFKIEVREWKSLEAMKLRRLFNDTNANGVYMENAGALNRRADILVKSAGSCLPE
jgi:hypothetical protein